MSVYTLLKDSSLATSLLTPNFQLTHTFRAPAKSLNILLGKREGGVCVTVGGWEALIGGQH